MKINSYNPQYSKRKAPNFKAANASFVRNVTHNSYDRATSYIALGIGKVASSKYVQKLVDFLKDRNYQEHLAAFTGCILSSFYMLDTARSKTIEKDQKFPLIMNQGVVCAMSTAGAYTLTHYINKKLNHVSEIFHISKIEDKTLQEEFLKCKADYSYIDKMKEKFASHPQFKSVFANLDKKFEYNNDIKVFIKEEIKKHKDDNVAIEFLKEIKNVTKTESKEKADVIKDLFMERMKNSKALKAAYDRASMNNAIKNLSGMKDAGKLANMINGFRTAKALIVFALIYRFVAPVVATPIANKVSEHFEAKKKTKKSA